MSDNLVTIEERPVVAELIRDPELGARRISMGAGAAVHEATAPADRVFLIESGEIRRLQTGADGSRRLLEILGSGDWFGQEAVGRLPVYGCQAMAMTDAVVWVAAADKVLEALPRHPKASLQIIHQLADRLSIATEEASHLVFDDTRLRLVKALLKFSRSAAATVTGDGVILRMTHEQLAQAVGAARETVSLTLTQLRQANLLRTGRNQLAFDPRALTGILNADA
jgi:CRP-like cAMP-binding protein